RIYVANGKGAESLANPHGPNPLERRNRTVEQYIAALFRGTLSIIDLPTPERMASYSKQAYACSPLREDQGVVIEQPEGNPIPKKVGEASPIKHVIYVIKENRTYDQVFGDMKEGNGDPNLCIFPQMGTLFDTSSKTQRLTTGRSDTDRPIPPAHRGRVRRASV